MNGAGTMLVILNLQLKTKPQNKLLERELSGMFYFDLNF
jgi:hypothetical protein